MGAMMIQIGVGLRSEHYEAAMNPASIDFVEVHAENFFADDGASIDLLQEVTQRYALSLHATSLGLGSVYPMPEQHLQKLKRLVDRFSPMLVSDHACFAWVKNSDALQHAGDLLPIPFSKAMLNVMRDNIMRVQDVLGQQILIENISSYLDTSLSDMPEYVFFNQLCDVTGCGLLLDLHNLYVNAFNQKVATPLDAVVKHIEHLEKNHVKEIHLAGISNPHQQCWVDDHSGPVSHETWEAYRAALKRFDDVATLIEWDTQLPTWDQLIAESEIARTLAHEVEDDV